jgi:hypothetical protein
MASNTDPANLIITLDPAFHASRTNATRYRIDPANATGDATRSHPDGDTLTDTTTPRAHGTAWHWYIAQRTAQAGRHGGKESLFLWETGRHDRAAP